MSDDRFVYKPAQPELGSGAEGRQIELISAEGRRIVNSALSEPQDIFVEIINLCKTYQGPHDKVEVLNNLGLTLVRGQAVAIVGASGVGKSTLLHILGALDRPDSGQVLVDGQDIFIKDDRGLAEFRNKEVGFVFQFHHLLPEFTALENVMMPALIARLPKALARQRALDLLGEVGLVNRVEHRVNQLSGGEQQRVAVARALVMEPRLLLADEPTGNLDEKSGEVINQLLLRLNRERNLTTLVVTHNDRLAGIMDCKVRMAEGQVHAV